MPTPVRINSVSRQTPPVGRAFTLIEILVAIGIISVLLGILLPAVNGARNAARNGACLSNQGQIALSWGMHLNDNRFFPFDRDMDNDGEDDDNEASHFWDWGGVNWYDDEQRKQRSLAKFVSDRPLNPYFDLVNDQREHAAVFQCPADDGLTYGPDVPYFSDDQFESHENPFENTVYGLRGSSYNANEWIWIRPGAVTGFPIPIRPYAENFTSRNGLNNVDSPSLFIVTGDAGPFSAGRMGKDRQIQVFLNNDTGLVDAEWYHSWWHGYEKSNMAFLDGSARHVTMVGNRGVTDTYSFWMQPRRHQVPGGSATHGFAGRLGWDPGVHGDAPAEE